MGICFLLSANGTECLSNKFDRPPEDVGIKVGYVLHCKKMATLYVSTVNSNEVPTLPGYVSSVSHANKDRFFTNFPYIKRSMERLAQAVKVISSEEELGPIVMRHVWAPELVRISTDKEKLKTLSDTLDQLLTPDAS